MQEENKNTDDIFNDAIKPDSENSTTYDKRLKFGKEKSYSIHQNSK